MTCIEDILEQSRNAEPFSRAQLVGMLACPPDSEASYRLMAEARALSRTLSGDRAEVHAQFALNLNACPKNCTFCSFALVNNIFNAATELSPEQAVEHALLLERAGANAVYIMTTASYSFEKFIEAGSRVRAALQPETVLIANTADQTPANARRIQAAGFNGVYHALRLREGVDTGIPPQQRLDSMRAFKDAGLVLGTCIEPIGPEHSNEEIADLILLTGSLEPAYSGAARRISISGTHLAQTFGMITELRLAQIVAITRLGLPRTIAGNCTHEPCVIGAAAGANLLWAEIGANPRDTTARTEDGRGFSVDGCRSIFNEAGCGILSGPSRFFNRC